MFARTRRFIQRRIVGTKATFRNTLNIEESKRHASEIQDMARRLGQKAKVVNEETFRHAYQRLKLDEHQLGLNHRYHLVRFYIFATGCSLAFGILIFSLLRGEFWTMGPSLGALILLGALAFQASFRLFQIERRELVDVQEWLRSPGSWIPAPFQPQATASSSHSLTSRR
jgi:hypothetical protein